ncbi:MAG: hypothetical protein LBN99_01025 [Oscillospiraceae bacterium]|jgi:PHD/YefM family antitoxin component YafN of YafNO toxin-antitoxin module|nr:hypothetical protein [Oscillospiraceae bacterium]
MSDFEDTLNKVLSDPEQMAKIAEIAKSFAQPQPDGEAGSGDASPLSSLDPKMLGLIGKLMGEYNAGSDKEALLRALTPYLKDSRRGKIERAAEMAKLARLAKLAMTEFGGRL